MSEEKKVILTDFQEFNSVVESFSGLRGTVGMYRDLGKTGLPIDLKELIYTSRGVYYILPDKTIKKILLYEGERHFRLAENPGDRTDPIFHLFKCDIVKKHLEQGSKRFKATTRKDGFFLIRDFKFDEKMKRIEEASDRRLLVCNLCFMTFKKIVRTDFPREDFNMREYLDPGYSDITFTYNFDEIPVGYKSNWQEIASSLKEKRGYTCEKCGIKVEKLYAEKFLNVHFTTRQLYTKFTDHAEVFCLRCHAEKPGHDHIMDKSEYRHFIDFFNV